MIPQNFDSIRRVKFQMRIVGQVQWSTSAMCENSQLYKTFGGFTVTLTIHRINYSKGSNQSRALLLKNIYFHVLPWTSTQNSDGHGYSKNHINQIHLESFVTVNLLTLKLAHVWVMFGSKGVWDYCRHAMPFVPLMARVSALIFFCTILWQSRRDRVN